MSKILFYTCLTLMCAVIAAEGSGVGAPASIFVAGDNFQTIHRQMGATGKNGYRPLSSRAYQSSARFHSQTLNTYGQHVQQIPVETTQEHVTQIQSNVAAVKKEYAKIDPATAKTAGIQEHIATITKHLAECEKMCAMVEKSAVGDKGDNAAMCAHCAKIDEHLAAVRKEEDAMLKTLGVTIPDEHADHKLDEVTK